MKTMRLILSAAIASTIAIVACQPDAHKETITSVNETAGNKHSEVLPENGACNSNAYTVTLESRTQVGNNWEWVWSVQNSNPGNGNGGTVQDLSHWGMQFGPCFNWSAVVSAAYSANGSNWTEFSPSYSVDPSQDCMTSPVLKFDFGTSGDAKSYYRLVLNEHYAVGAAGAYYKSGRRTGCCTFSFAGVAGCDIIPER